MNTKQAKKQWRAAKLSGTERRSFRAWVRGEFQDKWLSDLSPKLLMIQRSRARS